MPISQDEMFKKCDELGEPKVRENLNSNVWNTAKQKHAQEWLRQLEAKRSDDALSRQEAREDESLSIAERALKAAESANSLAREANVIASSARDDARSAKKAAWIAAIIAIIAVTIMIIESISKSPN